MGIAAHKRRQLPERTGFTLIELLLVIGIIAILASIVVTSVNPTKQMGGARDAQRWSDVTTIMDGFAQYSIDHFGDNIPPAVDGVAIDSGCTIPSIPASARKVCKPETPHGSGTGQCGDSGNECVWSRHLSGTYLVTIPADPRDDEVGAVEQLRVDYTVRLMNGGRLEVYAPNAEQENEIKKSR